MGCYFFPAIYVTSIPRRTQTTPQITQSGKSHADTCRQQTELWIVESGRICVTVMTLLVMDPLPSVGTRSPRWSAHVTQWNGPLKTARYTQTHWYTQTQTFMIY